MPKKIIKYGIIILVFGVGVTAGVIQVKRQSSLNLESSVVQSAPSPMPSVVPTEAKVQMRSHRVKKLDPESLWHEFKEKFGENLKAEFSNKGHLVAIRGGFGEGKPGSLDFKPDDPQKAITRAREIISAASELMGIQMNWPLENALARGSKISAQVFFSQTYEGIVLIPVGNVKVSLGSKGELLELSSDYASHIKVVNRMVLDPEEAKLKVIAAFQSPDLTSLYVDGGGRVIWVSGSEGRYAFDFVAQGRQVIVDAQSGQILDTRDIRQH